MKTEYYIVPKNSPPITLGPGSANIGLSENHTFGNDVVSQPLEDGSSLFDHIVVLPDELEVVIHTGNSPRPGGEDRYPSQVLYAQLKELRNRRELMDVYTLHEVYKNMAIKDVTVPNVAPFKGRTDITIKFIRISIITEITNDFPRSKFEPAQISANGEDIAVEDQTPEQSAAQLDEQIAAAEAGNLPDPAEVSDTAMSEIDAGEGEVFEDFPDPFEEMDIDFDSLSQEDALSAFQSAVEDAYSTTSDSLKTAYATVKNVMNRISTAYAKANNFTEGVRNKLQMVSAGISLISNLSVGAQRFVRTIKGQVFGISSYFNVLTNNWNFSLTDGQGKDLIAGAALVVGVNLLEGLNLTYTSTDANGVTTTEPLALKGMLVSSPIPSGSTSMSASAAQLESSLVSKGIESSPFAFTPGSNGISSCSILLFDSEEAARAYSDLISGMTQREVNFNFDNMDYTILGGE